MTPARVSVAMCTHNGERHLREQLESIANQTRRPDELVVCDDSSTDATCQIVADWAQTAPLAVRLHRNPVRLRSTKNFEKAIGLCTGTLIALSDQDDVWLPEKIALLAREFENDAGVGLVFTDADLVTEGLQPTGSTLWDTLSLGSAERLRSSAGDAVDRLLNGSTVTGATMAFRACFTDLVLPIPADQAFAHDAWIALLISVVADLLPLATPTIRYRQHTAQQIGAASRRTTEGRLANALRRPIFGEISLQLAHHALQRLTQHRDTYESDAVRVRLADRLEHFRRRARLPSNVLARLTAVTDEFTTGRYDRYSRGLLSATKDLLRTRARASDADRREFAD